MAGSRHEPSTSQKPSWMNRIKKNVKDSEFTTKFWQTFWILCAFAMIGIVYGQRGPSFLDLQIITHTNIEQVSQLFTSQSAGYIAGAIMGGVLYDHYAKYRSLLLFGTTFLMAVTNVVIPWCSHYVAMVVAFFLCAACMGALDDGGNSRILSLWGVRGTPYIQAAHFSYGLGGFIVPLFTEPFLAPVSNEHQNMTSFLIPSCNVTMDQMTNQSNRTKKLLDERTALEKTFQEYGIANVTVQNVTDAYVKKDAGLDCVNVSWNSSDVFVNTDESKLYIAYMISAIACALSAIPFIVHFCRANNQLQQQQRRGKEDKAYRRSRSIPQFAFILLLIILIYILYAAVETTFSNFLLAFAVRRLSWTKSAASVLTSIFWAAFAVGRFLGIWVSACISPVTMLAFCSTSLAVSILCFTLCALFLVHPGIWAFTFLCGITMAPMYPTGLMWIEQDLFKFSGKLFSVIILASSTGAIANPPILGHLLQHFSQMWYAYLQLVECVALVVVFFGLKGFTRVIGKHKRTSGQDLEMTLNGTHVKVERDRFTTEMLLRAPLE